MPVATIRAMTLGDVETLIDWAAGEGWNPGIDDAVAFHATDPDGFIGAFVDDRLVAGIAAVAYGEDYGFIGLYITRADSRGEGYGKLVWQAGIQRLAGRTIGLDGVDAQFENYQGKGFAPSYRTIRYGGVISQFEGGSGVEPAIVAQGSVAQLIEYDRKAFGAPRQAFLERWLAPPRIVMVSQSGGSVAGYAVARECRTGWKIGPLFADDAAHAAALFRSVAGAVTGDVFIDVPASSIEFRTLLSKNGLGPVFETTRMYANGKLAPSDLVYGVTTLELG